MFATILITDNKVFFRDKLPKRAMKLFSMKTNTAIQTVKKRRKQLVLRAFAWIG
jgi:hypothetical protein